MKPFYIGDYAARPVGDGFDIFRKGERSFSCGRMRRASDGKTWMFCIFINGLGREDARPDFTSAQNEVARLLALKAETERGR